MCELEEMQMERLTRSAFASHLHVHMGWSVIKEESLCRLSAPAKAKTNGSC